MSLMCRHYDVGKAARTCLDAAKRDVDDNIAPLANEIEALLAALRDGRNRRARINRVNSSVA
jgi:hypothetical protein